MKNNISLTNKPTAPMRHSGEYKECGAKMEAKAFWVSKKEISAVLVKIVHIVFSHMSLLLL